MSGILLARIAQAHRGGGGGGGTYLDSLATTPRAVLSLRKLISTATSAVRVRRSSDNAEQDIGFTGDALDATSLATFVGANSAYVTKVYDQTGNAEDAVQATVANQPRIVNAGAYDGKLVFDGSDDFLKITSLAQGAAQLGLYCKIATPTTGAKVMIEASADYNSNPYSSIMYFDAAEAGLNMGINNNVARTQRRCGFRVMTGSLVQISALYDRALTGTDELKCWQAGAAQTPVSYATAENSLTFTSYDTYIGARAYGMVAADMSLETLVFYNADTASIRTSIEAVVA